jgi:hypothetical protein
MRVPAGLLGINLGKNKASNDAATDYSIGGVLLVVPIFYQHSMPLH